MLIWLFLSSSSAEQLSLPEALDVLVEENIQLKLIRLQQEEKVLAEGALKKQLLPSVTLDYSWINFGSPLEVQLLGDGSEDIDCASFEAFGFGDLCEGFSEPVLLREKVVTDMTLQVLYPVTALYSIVQGLDASKRVSEVARLEEQKLQKKLQLSAAELYLQELNLLHTLEYSQATEQRLKARREELFLFVQQGIASGLDLSKMDLVLAEVAMGIRQAQAGIAVLHRQMELVVGRSFETVPFEFDLPEQASDIDLDAHLDFKILEQQELAAQAALKSAYGQLVPTVALMAATQRLGGQGSLSPTEQSYLGLVVKGDFQFGYRYQSVQQARINIEQLQSSAVLQQEALELRVLAAQNELRNALEQRELSRQKVDVAEQEEELIQMFFQQQLRTTAELLEVESALLEAQIELAAAEREVLLKYLKVRHSAGLSLDLESIGVDQ